MNTLKTGILLVVVGAIAVGIGAAFFGVKGAVIGLLIAFAFQGFSLFAGHKMAISFARGQEFGPNDLPWLRQAAERLSQKASIPMPKLYLSPDPQPNAFAAGWKPEVAVVCFNRGLIELMPQEEVIAVMAHEFAHIKNRDMLTMTVAAAAATFINLIAHLAYFIPIGDGRDRNPLVGLLVMIFAPITATMIQLAISRTREFGADATAAELLGTPRPMMSALQSLDKGTHAIPSATAQTSTAHMYIASPFNGKGLSKLFSTHPPVEDRIRALQALA
ncbi:MAG: M48 family metalloprotease [Chlorobia bacterium]|nr:M48 family metalloprotease [Fimbriimonadaceae bacterium]